jgi:hypothetical protein
MHVKNKFMDYFALFIIMAEYVFLDVNLGFYYK